MHVVFNCLSFEAHRVEVEIDAGALLSPENIVDHLLAFERTWRTQEKLTKVIHDLRRKEELRRKVITNGSSRSSLLILSRYVITNRQFCGVSEEGGGFSEEKSHITVR